MKPLGLRQLSEQLKEAGLPSSRPWINKMQKEGKLTLPKRAWGDRYSLTESMISECVAWLEKEGEYHFH
jgi:hypothetical protein